MRANVTTRTAGEPGRAVLPRAVPGPGGPIPLGPLLCVQAAGGLVAAGWVAESWALGALAVVPSALLVLVVVAWRRGETLPGWLGAALVDRRARRAAAEALPRGADPLFALAAECRPGLRSYAVAARGGRDGRERREVGMAGDGGTLTAVLRVEASMAPLQPGRAVRPLPLSLLYGALETDGIRLESVQSVQYTQPAPAPVLPDRSVAGTSYALLQREGDAPALRLTWVALRLDPELCPEAVAERGGGLEGAQRCLTRAADQLASRLTGAGFTATVLSEAELLSAVAACTSSNPAATALIGRSEGQRPRRTAEGLRAWRCDDRWHTTFRVARWPELGPGATPLPGLVALLTSLPAFATTFALTLRGQGRGDAVLSGHVRVTGRGEGELREASRQLARAARAARVGLTRMDRRQLSGLRATLPLGGGR
ncbi:type VII secretion protein EccE [Streptomyces radicis]|uniref:Type VII secretion protein EccE n=1 Tax=Streptomyces radicis TaxID=1750517 RepID=A0A3A9WG91_9ACTN|nr:type VII secretion protein EccE [Streptomyces radicis]RKN06716.1 type VII secretion protein EccE [Streptomyces radicis]RKN19342.1 type VII secretion protein EccE [Streptomyces radicis]